MLEAGRRELFSVRAVAARKGDVTVTENGDKLKVVDPTSCRWSSRLAMLVRLWCPHAGLGRSIDHSCEGP